MKTATGKTRNMKGAHDARVWMLQHLDAPSVEGLKDYLSSDQELAKKFNIPVVSIGGIRRKFGIPKAFTRTQIANEFLLLNRAPNPDPDTTVGRRNGKGTSVPIKLKLPKWCKVGKWVMDLDGDIWKIGGVHAQNLNVYKPSEKIARGLHYSSCKPVRFRPYTYEEAMNLLGKTIEYILPNGVLRASLVYEVDLSQEFKVTINNKASFAYINGNATINGLPFGFPEVDQEALKGGEA